MCLCVTSWLLSKFAKVICTTCIVNFIVDPFWAFKLLFECKHENIQMKWILDLNYKVQYLAFEINIEHIWAMHKKLETTMPTFVIENVIFVVVESLMKNQCKGKSLELSFLHYFIYAILCFVGHGL